MGTGALSQWKNSWSVQLNTYLPDGLMMWAGKASPFTPFCYEALDVLEFMSKSQCRNLLHITLTDRNLTCCHCTMCSYISVFIVWNTGESNMYFITELKKCNVKHFTPVKTDIHLNYVLYLSTYFVQNIVHLLQRLTNENHGTMQCFMMLWQVVCYWTERLHFLPWS
jgi:hypothetical protein